MIPWRTILPLVYVCVLSAYGLKDANFYTGEILPYNDEMMANEELKPIHMEEGSYPAFLTRLAQTDQTERKRSEKGRSLKRSPSYRTESNIPLLYEEDAFDIYDSEMEPLILSDRSEDELLDNVQSKNPPFNYRIVKKQQFVRPSRRSLQHNFHSPGKDVSNLVRVAEVANSNPSSMDVVGHLENIEEVVPGSKTSFRYPSGFEEVVPGGMAVVGYPKEVEENVPSSIARVGYPANIEMVSGRIDRVEYPARGEEFGPRSLAVVGYPTNIEELRPRNMAVVRYPENLEKLGPGNMGVVGYPENIEELGSGNMAVVSYPENIEELGPGNMAVVRYPENIEELGPGNRVVVRYPENIEELRPGNMAVVGYPENIEELGSGNMAVIGYPTKIEAVRPQSMAAVGYPTNMEMDGPRRMAVFGNQQKDEGEESWKPMAVGTGQNEQWIGFIENLGNRQQQRRGSSKHHRLEGREQKLGRLPEDRRSRGIQDDAQRFGLMERPYVESEKRRESAVMKKRVSVKEKKTRVQKKKSQDFHVMSSQDGQIQLRKRQLESEFTPLEGVRSKASSEKRSPSCLRKCLRLQLLHPAQCHNLCR